MISLDPATLSWTRVCQPGGGFMRVARVSSLVFVYACALASLVTSAAHAAEIQAGPIWNNMDAQGKCPGVCQQNGNSRWNGQWRTIPVTATSVCDCDGGMSPVNPQRASQWVEAGPLFNNMDAQNKCPPFASKAAVAIGTGTGLRRNRAGCRFAVA